LTYYKAYATSRQRVLHAVERSARLRAAVLRVEERLLPRYMDWATEPVPDPVVARETQDRLADFFADVVPGLEHLLERRPPWEDTRRRVADIDP
jgi:hypothetical protein